jgi:selenide,water dikinase
VLPRVADPNILVGLETGDDGAVVRLSDEIAVIQTLDFFMPIVDDPYDFGRIAAANSLSDVYAMGGRAVSALAILGLPLAKLGVAVGARIMEGGAAVCTEASIQIVGGHSIDDAEPKFGLSVTGVVHPDKIWRNSTGRAGDVLVLTKPLGLGTVSSAIKKGAVSAAVERNAIETMATLNRAASEAAAEVGIHAATDVTGFALIGHAIEMADGAGLGLDIDVSALPVLDGAWDTLGLGITPGATGRNLSHFGARVSWGDAVTDIQRQLVGDPQTSGGLLFAVAPDKARALQQALQAAGTSAAAIVGRLTEGGIRIG